MKWVEHNGYSDTELILFVTTAILVMETALATPTRTCGVSAVVVGFGLGIEDGRVGRIEPRHHSWAATRYRGKKRRYEY